ncbi:class II aldolase/adducin family protein [Paraburkholderia fungorum]|uniref:class II aldolase/adducin family protein n=1 Tax=Paraburkholderia fungorum TaxID=134537 RepID=UPI0038BC621F
MDNYQTEKQLLADAILMLERAEVIDFNGHFSWRIPDRDQMLINSGKSVRSALTARDIVTIDFDGNLVEGDAVPPMEFHIHAEIYRRRADVNSVVHSHPLWSTLFSMTGRAVEPVIMQAAVLGEIRRFGKTASINRKPLGEELAEALGPHRVIMLKSHGAVVAAEGILETFVLAFYLEENAQRQYLASQLGEPMVLSAEQVETIGRNLWKPNLLQKVWDYHAGKLSRESPASR